MEAVWRSTWAAISLLRWISKWFVAAAFLFMVGAVIVQVIGRHLLPFPIANAVELATFSQIWLTTIGASLALRQGALFAVDMLPRRLDLGRKRILNVLIAVLSLSFLAMMIYGGIILTRSGFLQTSPTLLIPMWTIFISIPIGMTLLGIEVIANVIETWNDPFAQPQAEDPL